MTRNYDEITRFIREIIVSPLLNVRLGVDLTAYPTRQKPKLIKTQSRGRAID